MVVAVFLELWLESEVFFVCFFLQIYLLGGFIVWPNQCIIWWLNWNKPQQQNILLAASPFWSRQASLDPETEGFWRVDPRSRRTLDSMLLCLPDLCPVFLPFQVLSRPFLQDPQMLHASKPLLIRPLCLDCPSDYPCLLMCLARTSSSSKIQPKDHFIHLFICFFNKL